MSEGPPGLNRNRMPDDWEPPAPAWMSDLTHLDVASVGYFGVQAKSLPDASIFGEITELVSAGADRSEYARFVDGAGYQNLVVIGYWRQAQVQRDWSAREETESAWEKIAAGAGGVGIWREVMEVPSDRLETLFSADDDPVGFARLGEGWFGPVEEHGYWGAMRDRIPLSGTDPLASLPTGGSQERGEWVSVRCPHNLCVIRSGQNPTACDGEELAIYEGQVFPRLLAGMEYLRDSGSDIGCVSCRFLDEAGSGGEPLGRTFGLAYFESMGELEQWAESHPTHEAIFGEFLKLADRFGPAMRLRLWHEVFVLDAGHQHSFDYFNCHASTGLLPLVQ